MNDRDAVIARYSELARTAAAGGAPSSAGAVPVPRFPIRDCGPHTYREVCLRAVRLLGQPPHRGLLCSPVRLGGVAAFIRRITDKHAERMAALGLGASVARYVRRADRPLTLGAGGGRPSPSLCIGSPSRRVCGDCAVAQSRCLRLVVCRASARASRPLGWFVGNVQAPPPARCARFDDEARHARSLGSPTTQ